jgi:hypothetical protein
MVLKMQLPLTQRRGHTCGGHFNKVLLRLGFCVSITFRLCSTQRSDPRLDLICVLTVIQALVTGHDLGITVAVFHVRGYHS